MCAGFAIMFLLYIHSNVVCIVTDYIYLQISISCVRYVQNTQLGETPLHNAAWHGYLEIVRTLCNYGAVPYVQNKVSQCTEISTCLSLHDLSCA